MIPTVEFMQRVKMADVARSAGVSVATVSKVVNGRYGVAQATVDRVQQVINQLGYQASLGAQSLRSHRTNVLGILVAEFEPFSTELLKGASRAVARTGYDRWFRFVWPMLLFILVATMILLSLAAFGLGK